MMRYLIDDEHSYVNVGNKQAEDAVDPSDLFVCKHCAITALSAADTIRNVVIGCVVA